MNILLVHHRLPWPLNNGMDKLRYNLLRTLSIKHELTLIVPGTSNVGEEEIKKYVKQLIVVPVNDLKDNSLLFYIKRSLFLLFGQRPYYLSDCYSKLFDKHLRNFLRNNQFDLIHFLSDFSGLYLLSLSHLKDRIVLGPVDDNVQTSYENYINAPNFKDRLIFYINYIHIKRFYKRILLNSGKIYFHSQSDLENVVSRAGELVNAAVLPVATEIDENIGNNSDEEPNSIVFVGGMGASFNQEAVRYFMNNIFPLIQEKLPDIRFYIVGNHPPKDIVQLHDGKSIIVTGAVASVDPYIAKAKVYVSPVRGGTGIKTKMVEAIKLSKAIVATEKALQGLWEIDPIAISIQNDPLEFANAVVNILSNDDLRLTMEKHARELFINHYKFDKVSSRTLSEYSANF